MKLNLFSIATAMLAVMTGVGIPAGAQEDNRDEYRPGGSEAYYLRLSGSEHHSADFHVNFRWDNAVIRPDYMNTGENLKALADSIASISIGGGTLDSLTGEYSFHAYMYSGSGISNISDKGRSLTITQPAGAPSADGSNSDFSDYLLSYTYYVSDGDTRPLAELRMVHATSSVELHFIKPAGASETRVLKASMSGVRYSATYSVTNHADNDVRWAVTPVGDRISYRRSTDGQGGESVFTVPETGADGSMFPEGSLYFSFLTCQQPVDNAGSPVTIQVDYEINGSPFGSSFSLDKVHGVSNWMAGTKTRYAIVLDSEARLYGSIEPWGDGGEMEGSMIP